MDVLKKADNSGPLVKKLAMKYHKPKKGFAKFDYKKWQKLKATLKLGTTPS